MGVAPVAKFPAGVAFGQRRGWGVVAAAPLQHLLGSVLLRHVGFVQPLQGAVVALIEAPTVDHRQPGALHALEHVPQGVRGALQHAGVGQVKVKATRLKQLAGGLGLLHPRWGQRHVGPAGESVFKVPSGLAVANKGQGGHDGSGGETAPPGAAQGWQMARAGWGKTPRRTPMKQGF